MTSAAREPQKILVPVDLSTRSELGVSYAAMLARLCGAELVLVTNVNLPERAALEELAQNEVLSVDEAADAALDQLAFRLAPDVAVSTLATFADFPAEGILAAAETQEVDLIVIASHGRAGMRRWLLGSVAEKLVRAADVPVVVVPARDSGGG